MNRGILGLIGAAALLSACNVTVTTPTPAPTRTSDTLTINAVTSFSSNWTLRYATEDQNGNTLAAGTSIICDNRNTTLEVGVNWTGDLQQIGIQFKGLKTGAVSKTRVFGDRFGVPDYSGDGVADIQVGPRSAPLRVGSGLSAQSIVVTPVTTVNVLGNTYVQVVGSDSIGNLSNVVSSVTAIPVANCS